MAHRYHSTENLHGESLAIAGQWQGVNGVADTCPQDVHADFRMQLPLASQLVASSKLSEGAAVLEEACGVYSLGSQLCSLILS